MFVFTREQYHPSFGDFQELENHIDAHSEQVK
jgi:hypothetical protein